MRLVLGAIGPVQTLAAAAAALLAFCAVALAVWWSTGVWTRLRVSAPRRPWAWPRWLFSPPASPRPRSGTRWADGACRSPRPAPPSRRAWVWSGSEWCARRSPTFALSRPPRRMTRWPVVRASCRDRPGCAGRVRRELWPARASTPPPLRRHPPRPRWRKPMRASVHSVFRGGRIAARADTRRPELAQPRDLCQRAVGRQPDQLPRGAGQQSDDPLPRRGPSRIPHCLR